MNYSFLEYSQNAQFIKLKQHIQLIINKKLPKFMVSVICVSIVQNIYCLYSMNRMFYYNFSIYNRPICFYVHILGGMLHYQRCSSDVEHIMTLPSLSFPHSNTQVKRGSAPVGFILLPWSSPTFQTKGNPMDFHIHVFP